MSGGKTETAAAGPDSVRREFKDLFFFAASSRIRLVFALESQNPSSQVSLNSHTRVP